MSRLPTPGGDNGTWGTILNDYLSKTHNPDGSLKDDIITATNIVDSTISEPLLSSGVQTKLNQAAPTWTTLSGKPAIIAAGADQAAARLAIDAVGLATVPVDAISNGVSNAGTTDVRDAIQTLVNTYGGVRPIHFRKGRYRLGVTGASSGFNRINLPSDTMITADPGAVFEINQVDFESGTAVFVAQGTDGTKQNLTTDITASPYGNNTVTLPTGVAATFAVGDLIGFEARTVVVEFAGERTFASEIRKIEYIDGNNVVLDAPLSFAYLVTDSAQFWKINPVKNIHLSGMQFEAGPGLTPGTVGQDTYAIKFIKTLNCRIDNISVDNMVGSVDLYDAYDTRVNNLSINRLPRQDGSTGGVGAGYGLIARGRTTHLIVNSMFSRDVRHAFTTLSDLRSVTGTAQTGTSNTITLATGASSVNDIYVNSSIVITSGTGAGQTRMITAYDGTSKVATVDSNWSTNPNTTSVYSVGTSWGGPMFVKISDSLGLGGSNGGTAVWDTHSQGWFIEFNDCTAIGGDPTRNPSGTGATQMGFQVRAQQVKITNPHVYFCGRGGITVQDSASNCVIEGGEVAYNSGYGIGIQSNKNTIKGVDIHHNKSYGISILQGSFGCSDNYIASCRIYENNDYGIVDGGDPLYSTNTVVQSCYIPKGTIQLYAIKGTSPTMIVKDAICPGYGAAGLGVGFFSVAVGFKYAGCYGDTGILGNVPFGTVSLTNPTLTDARIPSAGGLSDANGARWIEAPTVVASAVNWIRINNTATGGSPGLEVRGSDTNPNLGVTLKGTGYMSYYTGGAADIRHAAAGAATDVGHNFTFKGAGTLKAAGNPVGVKVAVPASATATGVPGQWAADANYYYVCTATNTWVRNAVATW